MDKQKQAAAYYRMSSDDQQTSITQQQKEVRAYAELRGYTIVAEYRDEGKSGSKEPEKRVAFQQLLLDATKGQFTAVLCWDTSRFSRLDGIDGAFAKQILRDNGIHLDTVRDGKIDWATFEDRLKDFVLSENNHTYSRKLAENCIRGRQDAFDAGRCPNGRIPYGYMRRYRSPAGQECIVKRGESFRKPRGWTSEILVNEAEANVVRFIFRTFGGRDISYGKMLRILTEQGYASPDGKPWHLSGLRYILSNKAYIGVCAAGARRYKAHAPGKFASLRPGEKEGVFPPLVDRASWDAVQAKVTARHDGQAIPKGDAYSPLCGVLICGQCGSAMSRAPDKKGSKVYHRYKCCSYHRNPGKGCRGWGVSDDEIIPRIVDTLTREVDSALLATLQALPEAKAVSDVAILEAQAAELRKKVDQAHERYLTAPASMMAGLEKKIAAWTAQLEEAETRVRVIQAARDEEGLGGLLKWWESVKGDLMALGLGKDPGSPADGAAEVIDMVFAAFPHDEAAKLYAASQKYFVLPEPDKFREFLLLLGVRVTLFFVPKAGTSKGAEWRRKTGRVKGSRYFAVDWERSRIDVEFAWEDGRLRDGATGTRNGRRRRRRAPRQSRSSSRWS